MADHLSYCVEASLQKNLGKGVEILPFFSMHDKAQIANQTPLRVYEESNHAICTKGLKDQISIENFLNRVLHLILKLFSCRRIALQVQSVMLFLFIYTSASASKACHVSSDYIAVLHTISVLNRDVLLSVRKAFGVHNDK